MPDGTPAQIAVEVLGWLGCALLIASILQRRILALRVLSLVSSTMLTLYNLVHEVWPMVAVNAAIVVINVAYLVARRRGTRLREDGCARRRARRPGRPRGPRRPTPGW